MVGSYRTEQENVIIMYVMLLRKRSTTKHAKTIQQQCYYKPYKKHTITTKHKNRQGVHNNRQPLAHRFFGLYHKLMECFSHFKLFVQEMKVIHPMALLNFYKQSTALNL